MKKFEVVWVAETRIYSRRGCETFSKISEAEKFKKRLENQWMQSDFESYRLETQIREVEIDAA